MVFSKFDNAEKAQSFTPVGVSKKMLFKQTLLKLWTAVTYLVLALGGILDGFLHIFVIRPSCAHTYIWYIGTFCYFFVGRKLSISTRYQDSISLRRKMIIHVWPHSANIGNSRGPRINGYVLHLYFDQKNIKSRCRARIPLIY